MKNKKKKKDLGKNLGKDFSLGPEAAPQPTPHSEPSASADHEAHRTEEAQQEPAALALQLAAAKKETEGVKAQLREYVALLQRKQAEFENFRKRITHEREEWRKYGAEFFLQDFLPLLDNYQKAIAALPENEPLKEYLKGFRLIEQQFSKLIAKHGVSVSTKVGDEFNPAFQEAMTFEAAPENEAAQQNGKEVVMEIYQTGFRLHDKVLRNALVKVGKAKLNQATAHPSAEAPTGEENQPNQASDLSADRGEKTKRE